MINLKELGKALRIKDVTPAPTERVEPPMLAKTPSGNMMRSTSTSSTRMTETVRHLRELEALDLIIVSLMDCDGPTGLNPKQKAYVASLPAKYPQDTEELS